MRLKIALLAAATAVTILPALMPASAQAYRGDCGNTRANNQAAGAVLGAVLGGVLGSNVSARGHRGDGTAVGAVVGALAGSEIGRGGTDCRSAYGYNNPPYPQPYPPPPPAYGGYDGLDGGGGYSQNGYRDDYRYSGDESGYTERYDMSHTDRLAARDRRQYIDRDYAGRECSSAKQITRLPDGTEIRRPVEACRDTYYGDWTIRD